MVCSPFRLQTSGSFLPFLLHLLPSASQLGRTPEAPTFLLSLHLYSYGSLSHNNKAILIKRTQDDASVFFQPYRDFLTNFIVTSIANKHLQGVPLTSPTRFSLFCLLLQFPTLLFYWRMHLSLSLSSSISIYLHLCLYLYILHLHTIPGYLDSFSSDRKTPVSDNFLPCSLLIWYPFQCHFLPELSWKP